MFLLGSVIAFVWIFVYTLFFDTPKEMKLTEANKNVLVSYEILLKKIEEKERILREIEERDNKTYRAVFEEDPIPSSIRDAGFGGANRYAKFEDMENSRTVIEATRSLDMLTKKAYIQSKSFDRIALLAKDKEKMLLSMPIGAPLDQDKVRLSSYFGGRSDPFNGNFKLHDGIDLSPRGGGVGLPIYAAGGGIVTEARFSTGGYGNVVYIDHGYGYSTRYGHLNSISVAAGQKIRRGDKVGELGNTGRSKGPHLHYEVRLKNIPLNPLDYFENKFNEESNELLIDELPISDNY
jgi:murein DD-endopeptidase MepM/ murein hydrolase activator NlpD